MEAIGNSNDTLGAPLAGATLHSDGGASSDEGYAGATITAAPAADTARAYPIGTVLGSYRLLQQIGAGGMGRVFVAEHVRLGRRVALKVLRSEYSGNLEAVQRFFSEARAVNCINHENIIEVSDFIESPSGPCFYIMELLCGIDLRTLESREGILPLDRALNIALQVCRGVGAAHEAGIIHRDLKPDNIFLIDRGERHDFVKLLDFGVAKLSNDIEERPAYETSAGVVVGTPDYMAPEQAYGQPVDQRCDIYSLGVILFEMVAGRRPFVARTAREVMVQHMTAEPPRPTQLNPSYDLPPELEELIMACLRKDPRARPATIQDIELQLAVILDKIQSRQAPASSLSRARGVRRPGRRRRGWLASAGVLMLAVSAGMFAWSQGFRPDIQVAQADGLVRVFKRVRPAAEPTPPVEALGAAVEDAVVRKGDLTIEPVAVGASSPQTTPPSPPAPVARPATAAATPAPVGAATTASSSARPAPAAPLRRKPARLDRDSVINPFE